MADSTIYSNITYKQISDMKHAIGFNNGKVRGIKHRKYQPYRNFYSAGENDKKSWEELVTIGFAVKSSENMYHISEEGRKFLKLVTGVEILPESN